MKDDQRREIIDTLMGAKKYNLAAVVGGTEIHNEIDALKGEFNAREMGDLLQKTIKTGLGLDLSLHYDGGKATGVWTVNKNPTAFHYVRIQIARLDGGVSGFYTVTIRVIKNGKDPAWIAERKSIKIDDAVKNLKELCGKAKKYANSIGTLGEKGVIEIKREKREV
jgi:hypothetical protein